MNNPTGDQSPKRGFQVIKIACPACQHRLDAQVRTEQTTTMCPECWEDVVVPSEATVQARNDSAAGSTKQQRSTRTQVKSDNRKPMRRTQSTRQSRTTADAHHTHVEATAVYTTVTCHTCHARVAATLTDQIRHVTCPDCSLDLRVPRLQDVPANKRFTQPDGDEELNHYQTIEHPHARPTESNSDASTPAVVNPRRDTRPKRTQTKKQTPPSSPDTPEYPVAFAITGLSGSLGETDPLRIEPPQTPPRWTFLSGVFSFPWHTEIRKRWLALSCGCLLISWIFLSFILPVLTTGVDSFNFGTAILFVTFSAAEGLLVVFVGAYATANLLPVVIETAGGNDRIYDFPELGINDWLSDLFFVAVPISAVAAATYGIAQLVQSLNGPAAPAAVAVFPLLLAVALLSSLEANSPWSVLTFSILRSIGKHGSAWAMFYVINTSLLATSVALVALARQSPGLASLVAGPLAAALMFIYARLLGRLGWKASTRKRGKKKKRRKTNRTR
jgi:Zn-finger nucleic acid-binding protein